MYLYTRRKEKLFCSTLFMVYTLGGYKTNSKEVWRLMFPWINCFCLCLEWTFNWILWSTNPMKGEGSRWTEKEREKMYMIIKPQKKISFLFICETDHKRLFKGLLRNEEKFLIPSRQPNKSCFLRHGRKIKTKGATIGHKVAPVILHDLYHFLCIVLCR